MPDPDSMFFDRPQWFCLRSKKKSEHLAARNLRQMEEVEAFCPRLRLLRPTMRGRRWFVEALFPGYLFARFRPGPSLRVVRHGHGITGVVEFGGLPSVVPDREIEALRTLVDEDEVRQVEDDLAPGDAAEILAGPLRGLEAVVRVVMPARERVRVLLEFLGSYREVEVDRAVVAGPRRPPSGLTR
jgi:transcriptional antiterminator RfaH